MASSHMPSQLRSSLTSVLPRVGAIRPRTTTPTSRTARYTAAGASARTTASTRWRGAGGEASTGASSVPGELRAEDAGRSAGAVTAVRAVTAVPPLVRSPIRTRRLCPGAASARGGAADERLDPPHWHAMAQHGRGPRGGEPRLVDRERPQHRGDDRGEGTRRPVEDLDDDGAPIGQCRRE